MMRELLKPVASRQTGYPKLVVLRIVNLVHGIYGTISYTCTR